MENVKMEITDIIKDANKFYTETLDRIDFYYSSGELSSAMGQLYQNLAIKIIKMIDPSVSCKHNDYITKWSKSGKYHIDNLQVDLHVYKDNKLKFILESKTYFDTAHIKRTTVDFNEIRSAVGNIPAIVWSGQNGMSEKAEGYYREECEFDYFVINQTKKRRSTRPVFETKDPLDNEVLSKFIKRVNKILRGPDDENLSPVQPQL